MVASSLYDDRKSALTLVSLPKMHKTPKQNLPNIFANAEQNDVKFSLENVSNRMSPGNKQIFPLVPWGLK